MRLQPIKPPFVAIVLLLYQWKGREGEMMLIAIRLPQEIENRLAALAAKTGRTKTYYARKAILELIEDMEDIYSIRTVHLRAWFHGFITSLFIVFYLWYVTC